MVENEWINQKHYLFIMQMGTLMVKLKSYETVLKCYDRLRTFHAKQVINQTMQYCLVQFYGHHSQKAMLNRTGLYSMADQIQR